MKRIRAAADAIQLHLQQQGLRGVEPHEQWQEKKWLGGLFTTRRMTAIHLHVPLTHEQTENYNRGDAKKQRLPPMEKLSGIIQLALIEGREARKTHGIKVNTEELKEGGKHAGWKILVHK
ncbi:hypothetical protein HYV43_05330 [Candidatus Micrarchaeota archaeon]|nr:hypothetical protein [Candidatus Micrarchaeota archaeon]